MKILLIILLFGSCLLLSGCIEETQVKMFLEHFLAPAPVGTLTPTSINTTTSSPVATTIKSFTKYDKFLEWLKADATDKHPYIHDSSKVYEEQYVCSQYTRDFLKNATDAGFETYAVMLTGAVNGQNAWHTINAVVLDGKFYFVEPQKDIVLKKEDLLKTYGFEYAYFGRELYISRNNAELSWPVNHHTVIGLNGDNFLYLK